MVLIVSHSAKMKLVLFISLCFLFSHVVANSDDDVQKLLELIWETLKVIASKVHLHPDTGLSVDKFLDKYNYPLEVHNVTTNDSYVLSMHRIPHGRNEKFHEVGADKVKPVVLLVHGLTSASMDWIVQGPETSLALLLADLGYDVWLANLRGNVYTAHETLTRKDSAFWDYSFHDRGYYDLPASIEYILKTTKVEKITYVGHSEGTTNGFVLTSTKPEYNDKINLMVLLSPIAYMGNLTSPLTRLLSTNEGLFKIAMNLLNFHGTSGGPLLGVLVDVFCNDDSSMQNACISLLSLLAGFDPDQVNRSMITVFFNIDRGFSVKEIDHFLQEIISGEFRQYDYGSLQNLLHYGTSTPPSYDITKITVPLAVYYAKNDFLSSVLDVQKFVYQLTGDTADRYLIANETFNHLDFLTAKDVKSIIYDRVIGIIQKYNPLSDE